MFPHRIHPVSEEEKPQETMKCEQQRQGKNGSFPASLAGAILQETSASKSSLTPIDGFKGQITHSVKQTGAFGLPDITFVDTILIFPTANTGRCTPEQRM